MQSNISSTIPPVDIFLAITIFGVASLALSKGQLIQVLHPLGGAQ